MSYTRRDLLKLGAAGGLASLLGRAGRAQAGPTAPAGRIFAIATVVPGAERGRSVLAIEPETGTWTQVSTEGSNIARVSPDGRWLATVLAPDDDPERKGVWLADLTGSEPSKRITEHSRRPVWSPDGSELIVGGGESGDHATWRVKLDGSEPEPLPFQDLVVDWSRDGRWLLLARRDEAETIGTYYLIRPDGSDRRPLPRSHNDAEDRYVVRWQHRFLPDNSGIVYFTATESLCNLWRIGLDGGLPRMLLPERADDAPFQAVGSPDGSKLVVMYFDRSVGEDGKKNDVIRGRHLEIHDLADGSSRPIALPDSEDLWLLDWR